MRRLLLFVVLFPVFTAHADALQDLTSALKRLPGKQPVRATMSIEQVVKSAGRFANETTGRVATAEVRQDETGVSITIPQALLDKAAQQKWSETVGNNTAQDAIGAIRSLDVVEALNARDSLLATIDKATVSQDKRVLFRGAPARQVVLKLKHLPRKEGGSIQIGTVKTDDTMTLWLGEDNLPIAADRVTRTTAGFMFLHGTYLGKATYNFTRSGDRLILTRLETVDGGSGMGQKVDKTSIQTLTIH